MNAKAHVWIKSWKENTTNPNAGSLAFLTADRLQSVLEEAAWPPRQSVQEEAVWPPRQSVLAKET